MIDAVRAFLKSRRALSIQGKLLVLILPCSVAAVGLVNGFSYIQLRAFALSELENNVSSLAEKIAGDIDHELVQRAGDLLTLAGNPLYLDYHNNADYGLGEEAAMNRTSIENFLAAFAHRAQVYPEIFYLDLQGREICRIEQGRPRPILAPSHQGAYFAQALAHADSSDGVSTFAPAGSKGEALIYFSKSIADQAGRPAGVLVLGYSLKTLENYLAPAGIAAGHGLASIRDRGGRLLAGDLGNFSDPIEREAATAVQPWRVRVVLAGEYYMAPFRRIRGWSLVIGLLAAVSMVVLIIFAVRSITGPMRDLAVATRELARGNLDWRVKVHAPYELEILSSAFNEMAAQIKARETEQKRLQDYLIRSEKLSTAGRLISGIAHELNNPLNGVTGYAELMLDGDCSGTLKNDLRQIQAHALRCRRIIDNFLLFVRQPPFEKKQMDLNKVIRSVLALLEYRLEKVENIKVVFSAGKIQPVEGDFGQIEQVMINLIQNACDAVRDLPRDRERRILLRTERAGADALISIADNGGGIAPENLEKIFEPFFTTKSAGKGTGLGLAIAGQIIKDHGGAIECRSRLGEGASFIVRLPALSAGENIQASAALPAIA
ncbi:MAG: sensor histidine kinase, partial [Elusimicrobiota bacterium]